MLPAQFPWICAVASCVELVLNQRLIRRLCPDCFGGGCPNCLQTGYRGRLPLVESLRLNDSLHRRIAARDLDGLRAQPSLGESARAMVQSGLTNESEVQRVLGFQSMSHA